MQGAYDWTMDGTANLLGALALGITDRIQSDIKKTLDRSGESAAAIIVIGYVPGLSVEPLRQVLALSHPGTVRLIDRLKEDSYVERRKAKDGRAVALHLTPKGEKLRQFLMDNRLNVLEGFLAPLSSEERVMFSELMAKVLSGLPDSEMDKHRICRMCSVKACPDCPIPGHAI